MVATATIKGQIVIPVELRRKLGIKGGTKIHMHYDEVTGRIILRPITPEGFDAIYGCVKAPGALKTLLEERRRDREREKRKEGRYGSA